ncbi:sugar transferase [Peribacillus glennii]|uniref:Sugar transferase n=1 Tax=Peribacillus glennii TaxID=2303991 RepID=A0A372LFU4_9BACI|nr:sugar transferase [Peribacillus glennii]RFU64884.1 sugar transferase [Peribacillus glennii]
MGNLLPIFHGKGKQVRKSTSSLRQKIFNITKRITDIIASTLFLILLIPLIVLLFFFYTFGQSKGPLFFKQERIGKDRKKFVIYKFRTMEVNAEESLKANEALYLKYIENDYKLNPSEDPRVTSIGKFLRKTSIDEIPQFYNVLKGDMSLVGPRPVIELELTEYGDRVNELLSVKPGITGYWAMCGRSDIKYPERIDLELFYIYNQGLSLDVKIIIKTIWLVFTKKGAY